MRPSDRIKLTKALIERDAYLMEDRTNLSPSMEERIPIGATTNTLLIQEISDGEEI